MLHETALDHVTGFVIIGKESKYAAVIYERKNIYMHRKHVALLVSHDRHQGLRCIS